MEKENINPRESNLQTDGTPKRQRFLTKRKIIALSIVAVIVLLAVWDIFIDPPAFWHFRQADKQAIVQYQRQHYPGAKVIERNFPLLGNPGLVGTLVESSITFEYDGVKFFIAAQDGELTVDYYPYARATSRIENIIDEFIELRGLANEDNTEVNVQFDLLHAKTMIYPFDDAPTEDLSKYTHRVDVEMIIKGEYGSPEDVWWLYDCYQYWISKCVLQDYSLSFKVVSSDKRIFDSRFYIDSEITSEKEFYSEFIAYQ